MLQGTGIKTEQLKMSKNSTYQNRHFRLVLRLSLLPNQSSSPDVFSAARTDLELICAYSYRGRVRTKTVKRASRVVIEKYYPRLTLDL